MKVVWSRRAIRHLISLREYIGKDSLQNAALVAKRVLDAVETLRSHPEMGRPGRVVGTRELVRRERLELIAVFHGRQKWPTTL